MNADGNENVGSVPSVLFQAPLGTYVGWNIIPNGPYAGQQVQLSGGYWAVPGNGGDAHGSR